MPPTRIHRLIPIFLLGIPLLACLEEAPPPLVRPDPGRVLMRKHLGGEQKIAERPDTGELRLLGVPLRHQIAMAYDIHPRDVQLPPGTQGDSLIDSWARPADGEVATSRDMLARIIEGRLGLRGEREIQVMPAVVIKRRSEQALLQPSASPYANVETGAGFFRASGAPMSALANFIRGLSPRPVVDETGLEARYDMVFEWDPEAENHAVLAAFEDLGLELLFEERPVEQLVVKRSKRTRPSAAAPENAS